ncbi:uncharacterized protein F5Z01DRAFT_670400 [Emericellopsis atlantica]|uniref:Elongator complex protein 6 n=1 Tax=Emericellopsis atlantica TaxID=2614577 RepID=A0A9P7ZW41_9HYPO|nr:uncharacterized protein F5Z01DRAFT_670400 [Emericellopsis atlantica]KAG9258693.1 hypothetical protein F5Z01DRAFT_670400 [Emericellopsis atlantica]
MSTRIPPLLESYLALPPEASLILLTSVLGASANWLTLRHLYSYLRGTTGEPGAEKPNVGVVLVSFMRDGAFWREGAGKMGLDLDAMSKQGKFCFVDGLTGLFTGETQPKDRTLKSADVGDMQREIEAALGDLRAATKILILDAPDAVLAATETTSTSFSNFLLNLRARCHATVVSLAADAPLIQAQQTTLEKEHAALVLGQAHAADRVFALRMLDTGTAKDVSGVVRINGREEETREFLYYVAGDGGVKVFARGT